MSSRCGAIRANLSVEPATPRVPVVEAAGLTGTYGTHVAVTGRDWLRLFHAGTPWTLVIGLIGASATEVRYI